jgi:hypothetical protein
MPYKVGWLGVNLTIRPLILLIHLNRLPNFTCQPRRCLRKLRWNLISLLFPFLCLTVSIVLRQKVDRVAIRMIYHTLDSLLALSQPIISRGPRAQVLSSEFSNFVVQLLFVVKDLLLLRFGEIRELLLGHRL